MQANGSFVSHKDGQALNQWSVSHGVVWNLCSRFGRIRHFVRRGWMQQCVSGGDGHAARCGLGFHLFVQSVLRLQSHCWRHDLWFNTSAQSIPRMAHALHCLHWFSVGESHFRRVPGRDFISAVTPMQTQDTPIQFVINALSDGNLIGTASSGGTTDGSAVIFGEFSTVLLETDGCMADWVRNSRLDCSRRFILVGVWR